MTGFRPFFNPATGEWIEFTAVAEDSGGQLVRFSWRSVPGGVITEPRNPLQNLMLPPLWAMAKAFGVRPYYTRWDSRIPEADRSPLPMSEHDPDETGSS
jgi:hypothetical protein